MQYRRSVQRRMLLTELETSARTESKRMTNHNTPRLSRMGLPVHCATFPELSRLNTQAVKLSLCHEDMRGSGGITPSFLTSALDGVVWSASRPPSRTRLIGG
jgi:hypothetical protein